MLTLDLRGWASFVIDELFRLKRGKTIDAEEVDIVSGTTAYVTRTERNNGVCGFIDFDDVSYINTELPVITIGNETAAPFVHTYPFYTGTNINILIPRRKVSRLTLMFIAQCFRQQKSKYSYGYAASASRLKSQKIKLPVNDSGQPDYDFMNDYMREREQVLLSEYIAAVKARIRARKVANLSLDGRQWAGFTIDELFTVKIGKAIDGNKVDKVSGTTPYITRKEINNGLDGFIDHDISLLNTSRPVITIGNETAEPFVQNYPFYTGTKVNILTPKISVTRYALQFIAICLKKHKDKYSYAFTINSTRLKKQVIQLPVNANGLPDWEFMTQYMQAIEDKLYFQYLQAKSSE